VILHVDDLEMGTSKGGRIWFSIGDTCFPEVGWYDLHGVLLVSWMPQLESFFRGNTDYSELCFMDGPYKVRLRRTEERTTVSCLDHKRIVVQDAQIDPDAFRESVKKAVRYYERMKYLSEK
jgi:hypothetical protein